jgi:diaminopimelate decarboxylase
MRFTGVLLAVTGKLRLTMESAVRAAMGKGLVCDATPSVDLIDLDYVRGRLRQTKAAFPEPFFTHAAAVKANSIRGVLAVALEEGFGAECASIGEVMHSLSLGFKNSTVIYDSPCKTRVKLVYHLLLLLTDTKELV